jgi:hypothetical protein
MYPKKGYLKVATLEVATNDYLEYFEGWVDKRFSFYYDKYIEKKVSFINLAKF